MKKIVFILILLVATGTLSANNILYFTYSQAARTVACLNNENELMIYCGYENELPTYVLVNEVWAEQITSSFYEIWLYGYDAYTGEEIYMPIDLECIYLLGNGNIYSAAQYLRFRYTHSRPTFAWAMPPYNPYVRAPRPTTYYYTYHYDIHHPGWHYAHHPEMNYHPYYMRCFTCPAPMPPCYTPGQERPGFRYITQTSGRPGFEYIAPTRTQNFSCRNSYSAVQNNPTTRQGNRITGNRSNNTITTTDRTTGRSDTSPAPARTSTSSRSTTDTPARNITNTTSTRTDNNSGRSATTTNTNNSRSNNTNTNATRTDNNSRGTTQRSTTNTSTNTATQSQQRSSNTNSRTIGNGQDKRNDINKRGDNNDNNSNNVKRTATTDSRSQSTSRSSNTQRSTSTQRTSTQR